MSSDESNEGPSYQRFYELSEEEYMEEVRLATCDEELTAACAAAATALVDEGYAVIPNVLSAAFCDQLHDSFWDNLETATNGGITRPHGPADLATFRLTTDWLVNKHGILEEGPLAHLDVCYNVRTHPRVRVAFARLYGTGQNLVISSDRLNYQLPPEWLPRTPVAGVPDDLTTIGRIKEASWLHIDQALDKKGLYCIQGLVNLVPALQDGDATLEVVARSHQLHDADLYRELVGHEITKDQTRVDWFKFTDDDKKVMQARKPDLFFNKFKRVPCDVGALVLWDSRLMHQGGRIRASAAHPRPNPVPRFVVYACAQPFISTDREPALPPKEKAKKTIVFADRKATAHWPLATKPFGKPRTYGKEDAHSYTLDFAKVLPDWMDNPILKHAFGLEFSPNQRALHFGHASIEEELAADAALEPLLAFSEGSGVLKVQAKNLKRKIDSVDPDRVVIASPDKSPARRAAKTARH